MATREMLLPFDGKRLRKHRERRGMLQAELALRCEEAGHKVNPSRISQLEGGDGKPSPPLLKALATALECEIEDLLKPERKAKQESA